MAKKHQTQARIKMLTERTLKQLEELHTKRQELYCEFSFLEKKEAELMKKLATIRSEQNKIAHTLKQIQEKQVWELIPKLR